MSMRVFTKAADRKAAAAAFGERLTALEAERREAYLAEVRALASPAEATRWQARRRARLAEVLGPFPERTPLDARIVAAFDEPGFRVENVVFESRPSYYVTANLYLPQGATRPAPCVLIPCGHSIPGKAEINYSNFAVALALKGYVALCFDPTGQGERGECIDRRTRRELVRGCVAQHHWTGKPLFLTGETLAGWRAWDGVRALDYLLSRPEVDPRRVAVGGNSGGGIMSIVIAAVDQRVKAVAAGHPGGSMEDTYLTGPSFADPTLFALIAPRACRIIVGRASHEEASHRRKIEVMQPLYEAYGCPERLDLALVSGYHNLKRAKREPACEWLNRWLGMDGSGSEEARFRPIAPRRLQCTKTGQVQTSLGGETMQTINACVAAKVVPARKSLKGSADLAREQRDALRRVRRRVRFERVTGSVPARVVREEKARVAAVTTLVLETEPGIVCPAALVEPRGGADDRVVIHVSAVGNIPRAERARLALDGARCPVLSLDVRDTGETSVGSIPLREAPREFVRERWRHEMLAVRALAAGRTLDGLRALDIVRAVDWLEESSGRKRKIAVVGEGQAGIWALLAAAFDRRIKAVAAVRTLGSLRMLVDNAYYNQFEHWWVPGVLADYDVPDLAAVLAGRRVAFVSPVDEMGKPLGQKAVDALFARARRAHEIAGSLDDSAFVRASGAAEAKAVRRFLDRA